MHTPTGAGSGLLAQTEFQSSQGQIRLTPDLVIGRLNQLTPGSDGVTPSPGLRRGRDFTPEWEDAAKRADRVYPECNMRNLCLKQELRRIGGWMHGCAFMKSDSRQYHARVKD